MEILSLLCNHHADHSVPHPPLRIPIHLLDLISLPAAAVEANQQKNNHRSHHPHYLVCPTRHHLGVGVVAGVVVGVSRSGVVFGAESVVVAAIAGASIVLAVHLLSLTKYYF